MLCEDGGISEAGRGITVDEYETSEEVYKGACRVVCGVRVFEAGE
ncbi:hypothetical protein A2U01_0091295 [Trifolium medium]|uniref:Uncharacterized protein n=1 Tax=Trifolium medium TaxID=97028 RepID=A0A392U9H8_9FABA|nr:hypothetical protein [Trifolium medium]